MYPCTRFILCSRSHCLCIYDCCGVPSVGVVHDGLHVVPGKQTRDAAANSLEPAVVILLDDVDDGSFHERQLIVLILDVVVDGNHCNYY